jgi:acetyl esterase/lipase
MIIAAMMICSIFTCTISAQPSQRRFGKRPGGKMMMMGRGMNKANTDSVNRKWMDIAYATKSEAEKLDIYLPNKEQETYPVIVAVHGGAFMMGDKADGQLNPMLEGLKHGYAVVSVNYRMSGEATFPANIQDVKAAIRWIRANAKQYHLDADKIAVWGGSAGGNLVSMAGTSGGVAEFDDATLGNADQSSKVQAVVDYFGPTNFLKMDEYFKKSKKGEANHSAADSPESKVIGGKLSTMAAKVKAADPTTYITPDDPPFFIAHGTNDGTVPTEMSIQFSKDLAKVIGADKVQLNLIKGAGHGGPQFEKKELLDKVFTFLDKWLK